MRRLAASRHKSPRSGVPYGPYSGFMGLWTTRRAFNFAVTATSTSANRVSRGVCATTPTAARGVAPATPCDRL